MDILKLECIYILHSEFKRLWENCFFENAILCVDAFPIETGGLEATYQKDFLFLSILGLRFQSVHWV